MKVSISTTIMVKTPWHWQLRGKWINSLLKNMCSFPPGFIKSQRKEFGDHFRNTFSSTGLSLLWPGPKRIWNTVLSLSHLFHRVSYEVVSKSLSSVTCTIPNAHLWNHNGIQSQSSPLKIYQRKGMLASSEKQWFCFLIMYCNWAQVAEG